MNSLYSLPESTKAAIICGFGLLWLAIVVICDIKYELNRRKNPNFQRIKEQGEDIMIDFKKEKGREGK